MEINNSRATDTGHHRDVGRLDGGLSLAGATQSCIKCGKHRMMSMLKKQKLFGSMHAVCKDSCKIAPSGA